MPPEHGKQQSLPQGRNATCQHYSKLTRVSCTHPSPNHTLSSNFPCLPFHGSQATLRPGPRNQLDRRDLGLESLLRHIRVGLFLSRDDVSVVINGFGNMSLRRREEVTQARVYQKSGRIAPEIEPWRGQSMGIEERLGAHT